MTEGAEYNIIIVAEIRPRCIMRRRDSYIKGVCQMTKIVGVRFKEAGKIYHFNPAGIDIKKGDRVIVETARGIEMGEVCMGMKEISPESLSKPLKDVIRLANQEDMERVAENKKREKEAFDVCLEMIKKHDRSVL